MRTLILLGLVVVLPACVERRLTIRSEPAGARVVLGGRPLEGVTPLTVSLDHHGAHRVEVVKKPATPEDPAYRRAIRTVVTEEPWYESFPFDLFAEVLWPGTLLSETEVTIPLERIPDEPPTEDLGRVLEEAERARKDLDRDE